MARLPFWARRYALHRVYGRGPTFKGAVFPSLAYPCFCSVVRKNFPPYWLPLGSVAVRFHPCPRWGSFRYPPLRCRGMALAGSGGRYVSRRDYCAGMRLPRAIGGASQLVSFIRRFTRPGGRDPCRGRGGGLRCKRACQGLPGLSGDSVRGIAHTVPTLLNAVRLCICRYWPISQVRKVLRTFFALFSSLNAVRLCIC